MGRVRFTPEQIIGKLREAELLLGHRCIIWYSEHEALLNDRHDHFLGQEAKVDLHHHLPTMISGCLGLSMNLQ
jgi:hypothetical protein